MRSSLCILLDVAEIKLLCTSNLSSISSLRTGLSRLKDGSRYSTVLGGGGWLFRSGTALSFSAVFWAQLWLLWMTAGGRR